MDAGGVSTVIFLISEIPLLLFIELSVQFTCHVCSPSARLLYVKSWVMLSVIVLSVCAILPSIIKEQFAIPTSASTTLYLKVISFDVMLRVLLSGFSRVTTGGVISSTVMKCVS